MKWYYLSTVRLRTYAFAITLLFQLFMMSGCTFKIGFDYAGSTAKDERTYTAKK